MQYSAILLSLGASMITTTSALGINCRGSALCPRAGWNNKQDVNIMQGLRDAIYGSSDPGSVSFSNGDHVICVSQSQSITIEAGISSRAAKAEGGGGGESAPSVETSVSLDGNIGEGGICLFPQNMADGATLNLSSIRPLADALLEHGCSNCGSVPIHFVDQSSNDPNGGILTFNYVESPYCVGSCISSSGQSNKYAKRDLEDIPRRLSRPLLGSPEKQ